MRTTRGILPSVPLSRKMVWRWKQTKQYEAIFKLSSHINIKTITSWNHNLFHNFVANMRWHPWCWRLLWWWFHKWFGFCCQATLTALTLKVRPQIFSAGTDARILRELGIPTIGFFIIPLFLQTRLFFLYPSRLLASWSFSNTFWLFCGPIHWTVSSDPKTYSFITFASHSLG